MNAQFLTDLVTGSNDVLGAIVNNGEYRIQTVTDRTATDDYGFPAPALQPEDSEYQPCNWSLKRATSDAAAGEDVLGAKTQGHLEYEITIQWVADEDPPVVSVSDKLQLRRVPGVDEPLTLDIYAVINQSNTAWLIRAMDLNT